MEPAFSPPSTLAELGAMAEAIVARLDSQQALIDAGRIVDLADLEGSVSALCERILALPQPEGRTLLVPLLALLQKTETLQATLPRP